MWRPPYAFVATAIRICGDRHTHLWRPLYFCVTAVWLSHIVHLASRTVKDSAFSWIHLSVLDWLNYFTCLYSDSLKPSATFRPDCFLTYKSVAFWPECARSWTIICGHGDGCLLPDGHDSRLITYALPFLHKSLVLCKKRRFSGQFFGKEGEY